MDPAYVVLLIGVTIAVVAIAGYLIAITLILRHVVSRLVTILGAVEAVTQTSQPVGAIIDDINRDLDAGRTLIENGVERLRESRVPVGATAAPARHPEDAYAPDAPGGGTATVAPPPASISPPPASIPPRPAPLPPRPAPAAPPPPPADTEVAPPEPPPPPRGGRGWWNR